MEKGRRWVIRGGGGGWGEERAVRLELPDLDDGHLLPFVEAAELLGLPRPETAVSGC
jgi:hypothetical protein